jgi:hypothetical protein
MFGDVTENIRKGNIFSNFNWLNQVNNDFSLPFAFKAASKLSGTSKVKMGWTSPNSVNVNLFGESTLKDTNFIWYTNSYLIFSNLPKKKHWYFEWLIIAIEDMILNKESKAYRSQLVDYTNQLS